MIKRGKAELFHIVVRREISKIMPQSKRDGGKNINKKIIVKNTLKIKKEFIDKTLFVYYTLKVKTLETKIINNKKHV